MTVRIRAKCTQIVELTFDGLVRKVTSALGRPLRHRLGVITSSPRFADESLGLPNGVDWTR